MAKSDAVKTRVLYVSMTMRAADYERYFAGAAMRPSIATQKYGVLLTRGLAAAGAEVVAICAPPLTRATCGRRFTRVPPGEENGVRYRYLPSLDIPVVKNLLTGIASFFTTLFHCTKETRVLCYGLNVSASSGARAAARLLRRPVAVVVSDVPEQLGNGRRMRMAQRSLTRYDAYILLAPAMNELVNPRGKPAIVLEGQADAAMAARENTLAEKRMERTCLYAGMLHEKYGALRLAEAFCSLPDDDIRLVLYGTGDAQARIRVLAETDARIEVRGVADNDTVVGAELTATLLVNPRPSDEAFTRYSFPSKNLEYMASGTPLITTNLPGMPAEYRPHVYLFADETVSGMARALSETLSLSRETLHEKGMAARAYVLTHKSNLAQGKSMLSFLEEVTL